MRKSTIIEAFNRAIDGIIYTLKNERNMKIHYLIGVIVLFLSLFFDITRLEMIVLFFAISLVIISEMINTAIEKSIDLFTDKYHELARIAKDVAAGAVLISSLNSVVVGYIIFFDRINPLSHILLNKIRKSEIHVTVIAILIVLILVIVGKSLTGKGSHLRGGMPSGHSALAFSVATAVTFISEEMLVSTLTYLLAILVGQSRIEAKIHCVTEVIVGAILGILVTIFIFQLSFI
ncbi:diacylglycerol kinase (ATP) [Alkalithermobacter thermoalcaliphilus JW-YL-7 = DSM 7308]|uniref:Diacylglycerol kinase n=1 Tax=Alkalithermobacter thermoalcaliphilus JW-YL-7 = DSM 7308 TaxID=1121328 RepID=A0A150FQ41_CLOPD|nr:diacylglycerol kinase [[Clostridium] paradoxum JW-YL-7 = DSM 7308]SHK64730.1 diacylglycerol kinase (ATP) [[Clostridium] paradoxum JW-YL-7 = DSM 7308]